MPFGGDGGQAGYGTGRRAGARDVEDGDETVGASEKLGGVSGPEKRGGR